jgi:hypothetical protein
MKYVLVAIVVLTTAVSPLADWGYPEHNDVVVLGRHNHDQFLKDFDMAVVAYTTAWCEHCKELETQYSNAALYFKDHHVRVPLARIDCTRNEEFCSEHLIPSYPYIKLYIRKYPISYYGPRTSKGIQSFLRKILRRTPSPVSSYQDMIAARAVTGQRTRALLMFLGLRNGRDYFYFDLACKLSSYYKCLFTDDTYIRNQFSLEEDDRVVIWKKNDRKIVVKEQIKNFDKLEEFLFHKRYPGLKPLGEDFKSKVVRGGRNALILFTETSKHQSVREFEAGIKQYRRNIFCSFASLDEPDNQLFMKLSSIFGIEKYPTVVFAESIHEYSFRKYRLEGAVTAEKVKKFVEGVWANQIEPYLRSEDPPKENPGPVKVAWIDEGVSGLFVPEGGQVRREAGCSVHSLARLSGLRRG